MSTTATEESTEQCVCDRDCRCRLLGRISYCGCEVRHEPTTIDGLEADLVERIRLVYSNNNHAYLSMETLDREDEELREAGVEERHLEVFNEQLKIGFRCDNDGFHWTERLLSVSPKALCQDSCFIDYCEGGQ